ncbi:MAG: transporter [Kiritimatiellaeota bacterium]|nr:transporter [Kiritimatiellota bacterium]
MQTWRNRVCLGLCFLMALLAGAAWGAGFQLYTEGSAEALGQAGAISARRDALSNAWYNPASMTDFARPQAMFGDTTVRLKIDYSDATGNWDLEKHWRQIPHFYYVQPFDEGMAATLALNVPYGLATDWPDGWPGSGVALDTRIEALYLTPAFAWKATDQLSLALGFNLVRATAYIRKTVLAAPAVDLELSGEDYGFGYLAAANYQVNDAWGVALKFQSKVDLTLRGDVSFTQQLPGVFQNGDGEADLRLPASITLGVTNRSIEKWTFGFDVLWTKWDSYDELGVRFERLPGAPAASGAVVTPKDWNNVFSYRFGAEYQYNENWRFRCGYVFDESPVDGDTRAPEMPGSDRHMLMLGCSYDKDAWGVDVGYSYLIARDTDTGNAVPIGGQTGDYRTRAHLASVSFRYKF